MAKKMEQGSFPIFTFQKKGEASSSALRNTQDGDNERTFAPSSNLRRLNF